ncbi:MAG TPA: hypothetical protein VFI39_00090 [Gemmatimonadales bacterium]|nr:hypothetical protein [Gemmatimonadales bacterium]
MAEELVIFPKDDLHFAAVTTNLQFAALAVRCKTRSVVGETETLSHLKTIQRGKNVDHAVVRRWLVNGWSTERVLDQNHKDFEGEALRFALHWAFPQAYYSIFAVTLAYFQAVGFTESSHRSVIRKIGGEMLKGRYPRTLSFLAIGGKSRQYANLSPCRLDTPMTIDENDSGQVDAHVQRFLNGTRKVELQEKKLDMKFPKKSGNGSKKSLSLAEWEKIGESLGPTSVMNLLYRKRIKANYRDIDTLLHEDLNAPRLLNDLRACVAAMNFVHESFISFALGMRWLEETVHNAGDPRMVKSRIGSVKRLHG